jgi:ribosome maturation factor RimP
MKIEDKIVEIIKPEIDLFGVELIDFELLGKPGSFRLSIFVDKESGISVDLCTKISRKLTNLVDLDEMLGNHSRLEVSSPGVERPLKKIEEFQRKIGIELDVLYKIDKTEKKIKGKLVRVTSDLLSLQARDSEVNIPLNSITKAVQALPW